MPLFARLILVLGISSFTFAKNIDSSAVITSPLSDCDLLLSIQTKLLETQDDIITITASMGIAENLDSVSVKINTTTEEFEHIKEELASEDLKQQFGECKDSKAMLDNLYDAVSSQVNNLQSSFTTCKEKRIPAEAITDIKALRFQLAEEKLKQLKDFKQISKFVEDFYANCKDDVDVLTKFIQNLKDIQLVFHSVNALLPEMARRDHIDPYQWMRLARKLKTDILDQPSVKNFLKQNTQITYDHLKDLISNFTLESLNTSVKKGKFERNGKVDNLTSSFYLFDPLQSQSIIKDFVNANYGQISAKKILENINSHKFIQQRVEGVSALLRNIVEAKNLNSDVTLKIASTLHDIRVRDVDFTKLSATKQIEVDNLIEKLPVCARNLFFLPSVCFWNKEKEEYLTAGDWSSKHDTERRNIFTEDPVPASHWYVSTTGDNFLFSSRSYSNEYLYAAAFNYNSELRYVFNWVPGKNTDVQSEWSVELDGDYCYIKSAEYNEYLFASNYVRPDKRNLRNVYTWIPRNSITQPKFQWQVRNCD